MSRLWDKGTPVSRKILEFTVGQDPVLDQRLIPYDLSASVAHAQMLESCGHLTAGECFDICQALQEIGQESLEISVEMEDCHTAIENRLTEKLGSLGGKIHLGRSRNDQVLAALRLYILDASAGIRQAAHEVCHALDRLAETQGGIAIPGYTHLQQAMPSNVQLWAGGFSAEIRHSASSLEYAERLAGLNPLGSAAGYGTPGLILDRDQVTRHLGFAATHEPVTAPQLSRGKAETALAFAGCLILQDIGRLGADLCLYASQEFGFVRLADDITTGSSIMPQKRNPDVFELLRGHSAQAPSDLQAVMAVTAKMTSGYHRDLQLIKEPLFRLIDRVSACLDIAAYAVGRVEFDAARAASVTDPGIHAAEAAFRLVQEEGISFREAYRRVGREI